MAEFTDTEIENAVAGLVRSEIKTERDDLGPLNTDTTWTEVRELVASTLVFDPSAVFYLLSLAANRVNQDVESGITTLDDLITAIQEMGHTTKKVERTSLLEDAATALLDAERLLNEKGTLAERPYSRYNRALDQFEAASLEPNIRRATGSGWPETYKIARPPQKAQDAIKTAITVLAELHSTIVGEAAQLMAALAEFLEAELPKTAVRQSLNKVRIDLRAVKNELDEATNADAISMTRDVFLRLRAGEAVTSNLRTISDPTEPRMQGTFATTDRARAAYESSTSSSTPAWLTPSLSAPYLIVPGTADSLVLAIDGGADQSLTLIPDDPAGIVAQNKENYDFHVAQAANLTSSLVGPYVVPVTPGNVFDIYVDGVGYRATLTSGSRTALQLSIEINAATRIDGQAGLFNLMANASSAASKLKFDHLILGEGDLVVGDKTVLNTALGFTDDQDSDSNSSTKGVDANNVLSVVVDNEHSESVTITPGDRTAANVVEIIRAGATYLDAEVTSIQKISGSVTTVKLKSKTYGGSALRFDAASDIEKECLSVLGFIGTDNANADYFSLEDLEDEIETLTGVTPERSETLLQEGTNGEVLQDVEGDWVFRVPTYTITSSPTTSDMLVIKTGDNAGFYPIASISLGGTYDEIELGRAVRTSSGAAAQNQVWELRRDLLIIGSNSPKLVSAVEVKVGNANAALGLVVGKVVGTTTGLGVVDGGKTQNFERADVRVGDKVSIGVDTFIVTAITRNGHQLEVTPEVRVDLLNQTYVIYSGGALAYKAFDTAMVAWTLSLQASKFKDDIRELSRRLNPLILNTNPSVALVNDAEDSANELRALYIRLVPFDPLDPPPPGLSEILEDFTTTAVARIDSLLNMLEERGLKHAHDLLLLGEFEEFFALTKDAASYGGNLLEKMRAIAQNDVPASTDPDQDNVDSLLTGSYEDSDADEDFTDQDDESGAYEFGDNPGFDDEDDLVEETL